MYRQVIIFHVICTNNVRAWERESAGRRKSVSFRLSSVYVYDVNVGGKKERMNEWEQCGNSRRLSTIITRPVDCQSYTDEDLLVLASKWTVHLLCVYRISLVFEGDWTCLPILLRASVQFRMRNKNVISVSSLIDQVISRLTHWFCLRVCRLKARFLCLDIRMNSMRARENELHCVRVQTFEAYQSCFDCHRIMIMREWGDTFSILVTLP